jgi:hypothetical protein
MSERTPHQPRIFTVDEANALLPQLRQLLSDLRAARERLLEAQEALAQRFHGGARSNGHVAPGGDVDRLTAASNDAQADIGRAVSAIAELGCELKDPDRGMVDFRAMHDGHVVYLCWLQHEPEVLFWHELDAGYRGRQPL